MSEDQILPWSTTVLLEEGLEICSSVSPPPLPLLFFLRLLRLLLEEEEETFLGVRVVEGGSGEEVLEEKGEGEEEDLRCSGEVVG